MSAHGVAKGRHAKLRPWHGWCDAVGPTCWGNKMAPQKFTRRKGSYRAVDERGNVHTIDVYQEITETSTRRIEGVESHRIASNGSQVNVSDDGNLEEVRTGRRMRRLAA
jgi:hypothetical protein